MFFPVVSSLTLTVGQERESRRGAEAGVGVCVCSSTNVGRTGRGDGEEDTERGYRGQKGPFARRKT